MADDRVRFQVTETKKYGKTKGKVVLFSGCMDNQTSADAWIERKSQGAMTWVFLNTVRKYAKKNRKLTCKKMIRDMQLVLKNSGFKQKPQITSGKSLNMKETFVI